MELMIENKIRQLAKKILHVKSFQELHDIIMEYASDELEFVEFPDSLRKFSPKELPDDNIFKKAVREIEEGKYKKPILDDFWLDKFPDKTYPTNKNQEALKKYRDRMMNGNPDTEKELDPTEEILKKYTTEENLKKYRDMMNDSYRPTGEH